MGSGFSRRMHLKSLTLRADYQFDQVTIRIFFIPITLLRTNLGDTLAQGQRECRCRRVFPDVQFLLSNVMLHPL